MKRILLAAIATAALGLGLSPLAAQPAALAGGLAGRCGPNRLIDTVAPLQFEGLRVLHASCDRLVFTPGADPVAGEIILTRRNRPAARFTGRWENAETFEISALQIGNAESVEVSNGRCVVKTESGRMTGIGCFAQHSRDGQNLALSTDFTLD